MNFYTTEGNLVADQCFNNDTLLDGIYRLFYPEYANGPETCQILNEPNGFDSLVAAKGYSSSCVIPLVDSADQYLDDTDYQAVLTLLGSDGTEVYLGDLCPETCGWLCESSQFADECAGLGSATCMEDSYYQAEIESLKERVTVAESQLLFCNATELEIFNAALNLIVADNGHWENAVKNGGLDCEFVPSMYCQMHQCKLDSANRCVRS